MIYFAHINSKSILTGIGNAPIIKDEYGSENVQNIEVTEDIYNEQEKYIYKDGEIIIDPDYDSKQLQKAKQEKVQLNDTARDEALYGGVTYQDVLFDSDTDQKINLLATVGMMSDSDTITWYGMDNQGLLCTKADIEAIGQLIIQLHSYCWNMNAYIKEQIQEAQTIEEVEAINIDYTMPEKEKQDE